jgi:hypothetical protein
MSLAKVEYRLIVLYSNIQRDKIIVLNENRI